ncbi:hypothetical protein FORC82_p317 (plasmid) [Escherichia coli]|uniref:Uncharacterized protein n=3 Tax=Enterobacteriaceae TaxID=543 RepID=A0A221ZQI6_ECOLX|nr:hypothetical protein pKUSR18_062 [Salmonella enterica subsp. enterica serovar Enteritidis]ANA09534.1 hypothetical protein pHNSHP45-2-orf00051 [Escherichia coli]UHA79714.1 hypothetical protein [Salmonella enterica]UIX51054.1 hypothetical protein [Escherichia coli O23:H4]AKB10148.1 hypothetical protein pSEN112499_063 [Salmonella enterica subsp. enterica serovar Enteritidis]
MGSGQSERIPLLTGKVKGRWTLKLWMLKGVLLFFLHSGFFSPGGQASISERFTDKQGLLLLPAPDSRFSKTTWCIAVPASNHMIIMNFYNDNGVDNDRCNGGISHFGTGYRPNLHPGFQLADFHIISLSQHELRHKN